MLKFLQGDMFESDACALVNTVNTVGVMGKGIALKFRKEFPHNYRVYRQACLKRELNVGNLLAVKDTSLLLGERLIINFPTKTHWRLPSEYKYVESGLIALATLISQDQIPKVAVPALGCGNGGLGWPVVRELLCRHLGPATSLIEVYEPA